MAGGRRDLPPVEDAPAVVDPSLAQEDVPAAPAVKLPPPPPNEIGVTGVRKPTHERHLRRDERRCTSEVAGQDSPLFPGGGTAFRDWCHKEKGIGPAIMKFASDWGPLLLEFALRSIVGHRRGLSGSHRFGGTQ